MNRESERCDCGCNCGCPCSGCMSVHAKGRGKDKGIIELELKKILDEMLAELRAIHALLEQKS